MNLDKQLSAAAVVASLQDGCRIGFGGWGPRRKPMALVREILRSDLKDLTIVAYGGPEIGMLCAAGKVRKLIYGFVSLDKIPVEPWFRRSREAGGLEVAELDEGLLQWGLRAAAMGLPFLPTRVGLGSDVMTINPDLRTVQSPYDDGETLLAMPAIELDVALLHVDVADQLGNTQIHSPDPFFDEWFARAAQRSYVSCERLYERLDLSAEADGARFNYFERNLVSGVVHAPFGAHPTSCAPNYGWDMAHLQRYAATAKAEQGWSAYCDEFLAADEAAYQAAVGGTSAIAALEAPIF